MAHVDCNLARCGFGEGISKHTETVQGEPSLSLSLSCLPQSESLRGSQLADDGERPNGDGTRHDGKETRSRSELLSPST